MSQGDTPPSHGCARGPIPELRLWLCLRLGRHLDVVFLSWTQRNIVQL
jgi:hypothetical protein